jgi:uncharacterized protein (TIGR02466 family)
MTVLRLFPTHVYTASLQTAGWARFNARLLDECLQLRRDDQAGRRWSKLNYPGGYTSYGSASRMHELSPTFAALARRIDRHVRAFARKLELDVEARPLAITDCWVNVMPRRVAHGAHLHPLSTISGTYYVSVPRGSPGLKLEDPRLERMMASPPRRARARPENLRWIVLPAVAGQVVLFESWLRHEVPANAVAADRVSVSFNYNWF